jgi:PilZ domain
MVVQLPESMSAGFLTKQGPMPVHHDENNKRGFHRHYMRGKAILTRGEKTFGTYTKDISRKGIGLLSPVQLLPMERVALFLSNGSTLHLEVTRCRRVEKNCYDCGAKFTL